MNATNESPAAAAGTNWRREAAIAAAMIGVALLALPFAIYVVGQRLLGAYDGGAMALAEAIWLDLLALRPAAWTLVLWPYVTLQLVRWARRLWRPKPL
jgi:hypothetical protein